MNLGGSSRTFLSLVWHVPLLISSEWSNIKQHPLELSWDQNILYFLQQGHIHNAIANEVCTEINILVAIKASSKQMLRKYANL